ncbi:MAG: OadG family protein [Clostridia bacterium]|nr:OadG family protein [Clostridia bacterium]
MTYNIALAAESAAKDIDPGTVVLMGIGTVFIGLISIIIICLITGALCGTARKPKRKMAPPESPEEDPRVRQEIIAAVCAACAEDMGADVNRLRVVSFKKV